ncbi:MAG: glycosyltransferase family 4 protein [Gammaproteobacteria bacterium]|nr:glycosyltransferase family 4 protein [Gammaproteobacteria bacterium]
MKSIALIGSYLPRQCGIATFTADLAAAILDNDPNIDCSIVAMNDRPEGYEYPPTVRFQIAQDRLNEYGLAAEFLNLRDPDVVCLQHEYGIFGGQRGGFIVELVQDLKIPLITTLHTVLRDPSPEERKIILRLSELSDRLVVISERGADFLRDVYQVPESKIALIHHGILDVPFLDSDPCKSKVVADDKIVILSFGLLSPGKGIEYMVDALPEIVSSHPEVRYFVVGATHPHLVAESGEDYRLSLQLRAKELGVADHIVFHDRFLEQDELLEFIRAAEIYVTPYLNEAQIVSGTLAYALGAGKAVVSTPYWYAQEMLANNRGKLVPFKDHGALAHAVNYLLDHPEERLAMRRAAYQYCRPMVMKEMGGRYLELFSEAKSQRSRATELAALDTLSQHEQPLPQINLKHLSLMTDDTGVLQHAKFTVPNRSHGYCVDDNARALIVAIRAHALNRADTSLTDLSAIYLSFLDDAFNPDIGRFRNFMSYSRKWLEEVGSEDSHGRALWALGVIAGWGHSSGQVALATKLFKNALPALETFGDSRAIAFPILGIQAYLRRNDHDQQVRELLQTLGDRLSSRFTQYATEDWNWHEDQLTYDNARLPQALMACGRAIQNDDMVSLGIGVLGWLRDVQLNPSVGWFAPVGNQGWFPKSDSKAHYDQQPLEAAAMIGACIEAYECTQAEEWMQLATTCFEWYLGKNDRQLKLYDHASGGCRDGLELDGVNENQGAESTLSYILSLLALYNLRGLTVNHDDGESPELEKHTVNGSGMRLKAVDSR